MRAMAAARKPQQASDGGRLGSQSKGPMGHRRYGI